MTEKRVEVADLTQGQVVQLTYDPASDQLHWTRSWVYEPVGRQLVDCTVDANRSQPGTATEPSLTGRDGTTIFELGQPEMYELRVLHAGKAWTITVRGNALVTVLPPHRPICAECGELWPCREERLECEARRFTEQLDDQCAHCGEPIRGAWSESFFDGVTRRRYHTAKKYRGPDGRRCAAALAEAKAAPPAQPGAVR